MRRPARLGLLLAIVALAGAPVVACSGGGGSNDSPTPAPTPASPEPEATIQGNDFNHPGRGYRVTVPDGWRADSNAVVAGGLKIDTFFSPQTIDGVQPNISITCEADPGDTTTDQYAANRLETIKQLQATDISDLGQIAVGGVQARAYSYTLTRDDIVARKVDVMFVAPLCAFTIAAAASPSQAQATGDTLNRFLESFALISPVTS